MNFNWNKEKDKKLKQIRGVSFAEIMELGKIINVEDNPNYPYQKRFIILYKNYIYSIPFVKSNK